MTRGRGSNPRQALEQHVQWIQEHVRSCSDCGLCCTEAYNTVDILPIEAERIAQYLELLPEPRRSALKHRLHNTVAKYQLRAGGPKTRYTCAFLEPDLRCALPLHVKPVVCLSFNPVNADDCDQEPNWFFSAHDPLESKNQKSGFRALFSPIPVAVLSALKRRSQSPIDKIRPDAMHAMKPDAMEPGSD